VVEILKAYGTHQTSATDKEYTNIMSTPVTEKEQYSFPAFAPNQSSQQQSYERRSSDEDGTLHDELHNDGYDNNHLRVTTSYVDGPDHLGKNSPRSPSAQREQARRLDDDLMMLRAERVVSNAEKSAQEEASGMGRSKSMNRSRSRNASEPADDFDIGTTPIHEKTKIYSPPANPTTKLAKFFKNVHNRIWVVRWFLYITPLTALLLIPVLLGFYVFKGASVGGVELKWFGIWYGYT